MSPSNSPDLHFAGNPSIYPFIWLYIPIGRQTALVFAVSPYGEKVGGGYAYFTLFNFTEQGFKDIKSTVKRTCVAAEASQDAGDRFIGVWWLLGQYDGIVMSEAPDEETATRLFVAVGMQGNIKTMSMRAFSEGGMEHIIGGLL